MNRFGREKEKRRRIEVTATGLLILILLARTPLAAEEKKEEYRLNLSFFNRIGRDLKEVVCSPSHWDGRDFLTLTAVSGAGLLLFAFDQEIQDWEQDRRSASSDKAASSFSLMGDGGVLVGFSAALYAAGELGHSMSLRRTALLSLESLAASSLLTWSFKLIIGRARPSTGESSDSFHPVAFKNSRWSLPSGHAAAAFSVATVIAEQTDEFLVDALVYSLAAMVGISRIHQNKHWASDVFFGSAIGYFVGKKVCGLHKESKRNRVTIGLDCSASRRALTLRMAF